MNKPRGFKPGNTFGKGRPAGSRNNATLAFEAIGDAQAKALFEKAIELALAGDLQALKLVLDRIYPVPKARTVIHVDGIHELRTQAEINEAMTTVLHAVSRGDLSLEEGERIVNMIDSKSRLLVECLDVKLAEMEKNWMPV